MFNQKSITDFFNKSKQPIIPNQENTKLKSKSFFPITKKNKSTTTLSHTILFLTPKYQKYKILLFLLMVVLTIMVKEMPKGVSEFILKMEFAKTFQKSLREK